MLEESGINGILIASLFREMVLQLARLVYNLNNLNEIYMQWRDERKIYRCIFIASNSDLDGIKEIFLCSGIILSTRRCTLLHARDFIISAYSANNLHSVNDLHTVISRIFLLSLRLHCCL